MRVSDTRRIESAGGGVPERVRQQLRWAFDAAGRLNGGWFLTILWQERVVISSEEMLVLASELTPQGRGGARGVSNN